MRIITCFGGWTTGTFLMIAWVSRKKITSFSWTDNFVNVFNSVQSPRELSHRSVLHYFLTIVVGFNFNLTFRLKPQVGGITIVTGYKQSIFQVQWLIATLIHLFKLLDLLVSSFQNFTWELLRNSKVVSFELSSIGHKFFTLRIFQKTCDYLSRFTIGRNTLSNTMDPLEFNLVCVFHTKFCFKESNQNLSCILLHNGFQKSEDFPAAGKLPFIVSCPGAD